MLVAVFPANICRLPPAGRFHFAPWLLWARLPLQGVLIAWVWFVAIQRSPRKRIVSGVAS